MVAFDYTEIANVALDLIIEFGRTVTFSTLNRTPVDPAKPWDGAADPIAVPAATLSISAVAVPPASATRLGFSSEESDLVKRSEQVLIVATGVAVQTDLSTFDEVVDEGIRYKIEGVEKLRPGGTTLLWFVGVSR